MWIKKIKLISFRNQDYFEIEFTENINIIEGANGVGKTTLIEGVFYLANLKSHRTFLNLNLIKRNKRKATLEGTFQEDKTTKVIKAEISIEKKSAWLNNIPNQNKEITETVLTIMFEPNDLDLIKGDPATRRKYITEQLNQLSSKHYLFSGDYEKILKQRNQLLKSFQKRETNNDELLKVLTDKLIEKAILIYQARYNYIESINKNIGDIYFDITKNKGLNIFYQTGQSFSNFEKEEIKEELKNKFSKVIREEKERGTTLVGPHRDELIFRVGNDDLRHFGSQGQQRLAVIALKLAEIPIFHKRKGKFPIILLDDIFSELDEEKKNKLLKYLNKNMQIIITTTDLKTIDPSLTKRANIIKLEAEVDNERKI